MRELVIGDLHFGVKSNSTEWLESQLDLFKKQIFDIIDTKDLDRIVFLGDLHDIRYSVNQQTGIELRNIITRLSQKFAKANPLGYIVFVAGNHDYYSPLEEYNKYNIYRLLFGEEYLKAHTNIKIVDTTPLCIDDSLFLPWYWTENTDHFDEMLYRYDFIDEIKAVYCHADLSVWPGARITSLRGCPVYSGHIHYIVEDEVCNLHNVGAALPLTFGDVNAERYLYILEDFKYVEKIPNVTTPKFVRVFNEAIFDIDPEIFTNSYVQLCISKSNINKAQYVEQIKFLKTTYCDANLRIHIVDEEIEEVDNIEHCAWNTNITKYIDDNIPEHLNDKYNIIKQKVSER